MDRFQNGLRLIAVCVLVVVAVELAGIWIQLGHIRTEQVKNGLYGAHPTFLQQIEAAPDREWRRKLLESTIAVGGSVRIDDEQPIRVEVSR